MTEKGGDFSPDSEPEGVLAAAGWGHPGQCGEDVEQLRTHRKRTHVSMVRLSWIMGSGLDSVSWGKLRLSPLLSWKSLEGQAGIKPLNTQLAGRTREPG